MLQQAPAQSKLEGSARPLDEMRMGTLPGRAKEGEVMINAQWVKNEARVHKRLLVRSRRAKRMAARRQGRRRPSVPIEKLRKGKTERTLYDRLQ